MSIDNVISIIISILGSSVITLILSTFIFQPLQDKKKYVFEEKKRVYESIIVFAQIVLFPAEAKFSLGVASCGIYNFILPVDYRLTELHIVDPFDNNKNLKKKKHFKYDVFYDCESHIQVVQMQLRSARGNFSFILTGEACIDDGKNKFIDCKEQNIYLDEDIREFFFDDGIKKSFWKNLKESILLEPNFNGIGIDLKKLFQK